MPGHPTLALQGLAPPLPTGRPPVHHALQQRPLTVLLLAKHPPAWGPCTPSLDSHAPLLPVNIPPSSPEKALLSCSRTMLTHL